MNDLDDLLRSLDSLYDLLEKDTDFSDAPLSVGLCCGMSCMGRPQDMVALIKAGYGFALRPRMVIAAVGNNKGVIASKKIPLVQVAIDKNGCVMHKDGKCLLWPSALTPLMGKMHLLKEQKLGTKAMKILFYICVMEWLDPANASNVMFCLKSLESIEKDEGNNHTN